MSSRDKPKTTTKAASRQTKSQSSHKPSLQSTSPRVIVSTRASAARDGGSGGGGSNNRKTNNNRKSIELNHRHGIRKAQPQAIRSESSNRENNEVDGDSSEMASTSLLRDDNESSNNLIEQETNVDMSCQSGRNENNQVRDDDDDDDDESSTLLESFSTPLKEPPAKSGTADKPNNHLPDGWEQHTDQLGPYFWHVPTGLIQRTRPTAESLPKSDSVVLFHDDEEINQPAQVICRKVSSDDDELDSCGAALTVADDTTLNDPTITFIVYPVGCCEFDETQLISSGTTKAIQRCILKLSNKATKEEAQCWGLDQSQPVLMRLIDNLIHFTDIKTQCLIRSQPIPGIKTWAVDDDNNFAFVVEDCPQNSQAIENVNSVDEALLNAPTFMCYVFRSMDDDDMSCKVAAKLNEEINRYREQMSQKIIKNTRLQQMIELPQAQAASSSNIDYDQATDIDEDLEDLEESGETTMNVKYIGKVQVPKAMGVDTLNAAIDKCLTDASIAQLNRLKRRNNLTTDNQDLEQDESDASVQPGFVPLVDSKIHVSPSSVIVENKQTGEIIVECRIRYLTFIGISRRDIRWCGFIMQNTTNKSFVAHCFECNPSAEHVCEAIRLSCMRMYEKVVKNHQKQTDATSIIPKSSLIRDTLAKTLSRIKLSPSM